MRDFLIQGENKMKTITAKEISENLPMRVRDIKGIFKGSIIRFYEVNTTGKLLGIVVGKPSKKVAILNPNYTFELLK